MPGIDKAYTEPEEIMSTTALSIDANGVPTHTREYQWRRFLNWFPLGFGYASMMFMRYILNTAKTALGDESMTTSDFNFIFSAGAVFYFIGFMVHGPITDRRGGRWAMLYGVLGAMISCFLMGLVLYGRTKWGTPSTVFWPLLTLYCANMFFQSCAAMAIVTTKLPWFHVRHRGTFSTIFGLMISAGIYFAFDWGYALLQATRATLQQDKMSVFAKAFSWLLGTGNTGVDQNWWLFFFPALFALMFWIPMVLFLRNTPGDAGFENFDPGDQHVSDRSLGLWEMIKQLFTNPEHRVLRTIVFIEFCTGAVRNGVLQQYPHFAKAVGFNRDFFVSANWGLCILVCGTIGAISTGWMSDRFFQSRRGPMSLIYYVLMAMCIIVMATTITNNTAVFGSMAMGIALLVCMAGSIGVHGILSGTATGDFAGVKNTAKSVGIVDGAVYIGTSLQAVLTGMFVSTHGEAASDPANWIAWPIILIPFAFIGTLLCARIYHALPRRKTATTATPVNIERNIAELN